MPNKMNLISQITLITKNNRFVPYFEGVEAPVGVQGSQGIGVGVSVVSNDVKGKQKAGGTMMQSNSNNNSKNGKINGKGDPNCKVELAPGEEEEGVGEPYPHKSNIPSKPTKSNKTKTDNESQTGSMDATQPVEELWKEVFDPSTQVEC